MRGSRLLNLVETFILIFGDQPLLQLSVGAVIMLLLQMTRPA